MRLPLRSVGISRSTSTVKLINHLPPVLERVAARMRAVEPSIRLASLRVLS
jgi:hypothetical protein